MSDPGFNFLADNFLGGTMFMTDAQVGKYIRALCAQKLQGHLPQEDIDSIVRGDKKVMDKFTRDENGLFFNERLQIEINKRIYHSEKQRDRINKRWHKDNTAVLPGNKFGNTCNETDIEIETDIGIESTGKEVKKENPIVADILKYLNEKLGTHFRSDTAGFISGRLREGYTIDDFKKVIDKKYLQWADDEKMVSFLRPKTLFSPEHFGEYLNEIDHINPDTENLRRDRMLRERGLIK